MDTDAAIAALSQGARAVLPVHLYGQATDTAALSAAASEADAVVVEDAAQSQGVRIGSRSIGAHALAATTSFYPGKRSEEHTSELQSLMRISYAVFCLKKKKEKK